MIVTAVALATMLGPDTTNAYFRLTPGLRLTYAHGHERDIITVLRKTERIDGVLTRAVEDRETVDGRSVEVTRDYYAGDRRTGDVYYFGEDVDKYRNGRVVGHEGSWRSGVGGARYGLMMPGHPTAGESYFEERAPSVAMDKGRIVSLTQIVNVPAGRFDNCVYVRETSPLEPGTVEYKWYARGIGVVRDAELDLVKVEQVH